MKDHLGNVRLVFSDQKDVNIGTTTRYRYNLDVRAVNNYYPFGILMPDMNWQTSGYRYGFGSHENDNDVKGEGNHSSFGDYGFDPRVGRRLMLEPMISKFPSLSPYVSYADNPVVFSDPDGKLILFFNGIHEGNGGTAAYWRRENGEINVDEELKKKIGDNSVMYIDGSMGGWDELFDIFEKYKVKTHKVKNNSVNMMNRFVSGYMLGLADAEKLYNSLDNDNHETIKVVAHSMGSAFARGYVKALLEWADKNDKPIIIEYTLDINAFQGESLPEVYNNINVWTSVSKTGGKDGGFLRSTKFLGINVLDIKQIYEFLNLNSVPTVGKPKDTEDITLPSEKEVGHAVKDFNFENIEYIGNGPKSTQGEQNIERGSNNEKEW